jgi:hypothetical protein
MPAYNTEKLVLYAVLICLAFFLGTVIPLYVALGLAFVGALVHASRVYKAAAPLASVTKIQRRDK